MTVSPEVVRARLAHLAHILTQLQRLRELSPAERAQPLYRLAAERALHVAAEAIFDIGHHVLAGRGLKLPQAYRDVLPALVAAGVVPAELGKKLDGLAGLRNIIVHDYVEVDEARLWTLIEDRLADLQGAYQALSQLEELR